jgi:hypothetical protein
MATTANTAAVKTTIDSTRSLMRGSPVRLNPPKGQPWGHPIVKVSMPNPLVTEEVLRCAHIASIER